MIGLWLNLLRPHVRPRSRNPGNPDSELAPRRRNPDFAAVTRIPSACAEIMKAISHSELPQIFGDAKDGSVGQSKSLPFPNLWVLLVVGSGSPCATRDLDNSFPKDK
jgi:hypothetical protein